jgi:methyltransferase
MTVSFLALVLALMLIEARHSVRNERRLRARGAVEPEGDVYRSMQVAYPGGFVVMAIEGLIRGSGGREQLIAGATLFVIAKALKYWAIATLGSYWSFRVLVIPKAPLVRSGPYAFLRHPNYIAVMGEFISAALVLNAPVAGVAATLVFAALLRRRIALEERALLDR